MIGLRWWVCPFMVGFWSLGVCVPVEFLISQSSVLMVIAVVMLRSPVPAAAALFPFAFVGGRSVVLAGVYLRLLSTQSRCTRWGSLSSHLGQRVFRHLGQ